MEFDEAFVFLGQFPIVQRARAGNAYSPATARWVKHLPNLFINTCKKWHFHPAHALPDGQLGVVVLGTDTRTGDGRVLKLSCPSVESRREITALRTNDGKQTPKVFQSNLRESTVLMEVLGRALAQVPGLSVDDQLTQCMDAAKRYWKSNPHSEVSAYHCTNRFRNEYTLCHRRFPGFLTDDEFQMMVTFSHVAHTPHTHLFDLVGDPHAHNLLESPDGSWKWIDITGWTGPKAFDAGKALALSWGDDVKTKPLRGDVLVHRLEVVSNSVGLPVEDVGKWMIVHRYSAALWLFAQKETDWAIATRDGTRNGLQTLRDSDHSFRSLIDTETFSSHGL